MINEVIKAVKNLANEEFASHHTRFFKTGKGEYGEGDKFYGLKSPDVKSVCDAFCGRVTLDDIDLLLKNEYHEVRSAALSMMIKLYQSKKASPEAKSAIYKLYMSNLDYINNWDLVDISAAKIVGDYLYNFGDKGVLEQLAQSGHLWSERVSVVATHYFIRQGDYRMTLLLSEYFLSHKHDLMHKATGWMLREVGKRDLKVLFGFLDKHHKVMPRTMLRYSIEKLTPNERKHYMQK